MSKIAIVGSRSFEDEKYILEVFTSYISQIEEDITIVSGGCPRGADRIAKKIALELGIKYVEFPPIHARWNEFCVLSKEHYGKIYSVRNFFERNTEIAKFCDCLLAFTVKNLPCSGTLDTYNKAKKLGKTVNLYTCAA